MKKLISVLLALAMVLSLSAGVFAYEAPAGVNSLAIVGQDIPGVGAWNPGDAAGDCALVADNVYEKVIEVTAATTMTVKFAGNDKWDDSCNLGGSYDGDPLVIGEVKTLTNGSGAKNMSLTVDEACTLKFTVDMTAGVNAATVLVEKVVEEEEGGEGNVIADVSKEFASASWANSDGVVFVPSADGTLTVDVTAFSSDETPEGYVTDLFNNDSQDWGGEHYATEAGKVEYPITAGVTYVLFVYPAAVNGGWMNWATSGSVSYTVSADVECEISEIKEPEPGEDENNPIVFDTENYTANVPASSTVWFAFDDYVGMYEEGIYERNYVITGNTGFGVTNFVDSYADTDGSVSCTAYGNYMGQYIFSITNLTDSDQTYQVVFSNVDAGGDEGGEEGGEEEYDNIVYGDGNISITDAASTDAEPWTYIFTTESTGTLHVVIGECAPGWRYKIITPDGVESLYKTKFNTGADAVHELDQIGTYELRFYAYSSAEASNVDGTISVDITFTPKDIEQEIVKEEYIVSDVLLGLGENNLTLDENATTTVYEFCPEETGVYVFTVNNETALVGYWGAGSFYVWDQTENKTYTLEQELSAVGQSIMVGVSGVEGEFTLTVEKKGDAEEIVQTEYNDYVNVHVPTEDNLIDTTDEQVNNVDITKPQTVVKDENGFYHLGSVDGPLLYVNLISDGFDITAPYYSSMGAITLRGQYIDEDGTVYNYDFLSAMRNYADVIYWTDYENALYPLTEDLMIFMKGYGAYQGWFMPGLSSFEAINSEHNADSAWLVACVYLGDPIVDEIPGEDDENPASGDFSIAGLVVAMMAATAGAVVIGKKKEF